MTRPPTVYLVTDEPTEPSPDALFSEQSQQEADQWDRTTRALQWVVVGCLLAAGVLLGYLLMGARMGAVLDGVL